MTVETVIEYLNKNVRNAQLIMKQAVKSLARTAAGLQVWLSFAECDFYRAGFVARSNRTAGFRPSLESIRRRVRGVPQVVNLRYLKRCEVMKKRIFVMSTLAAVMFLAATCDVRPGRRDAGAGSRAVIRTWRRSRCITSRRRVSISSCAKRTWRLWYRCEEIIAGNPTFAKIDEVLYLAGKSSLNLAEGKGKTGAEPYT